VALARTWTNVAPEVSATSGTIEVGGGIPDATTAGVTSSFVVGADVAVERVEVALSATHTSRGQLQVVLTSPAGTRSVLAARRPSDTGDHFSGWTFSTVRSLGESAAGTWTLTVSDLASGTTGTFGSWTLTVHGTPGPGYVPPPTPLLVTVAAGEAATGWNFGVQASAPPAIVFDVPTGQTQVDATPRSGSDALVKQGAGTLVLAAANTHTGGVSVQAGSVVIRDAAALGTGPVAVAAGSRLVFDVGAAGVTGGSLAADGLVDIGVGSFTVAAGLDVAAVRGMLVEGRGDGSWNGTSGVGSTAAETATVGGAPRAVGWLDNGDGSFSFSFAAPGDTNLDAAVDILDAANVLAGGAYDTGVAASWSQGDTTYDGVVDILDIADFLGTALYDQPPYRAAAAPEASTPTARGTLPSAGPAAPLRSSRDLAFAAWAGDAAASADGATAPRRRAARLR
jgi:autotransporter-associated beta strand protein